MASSTKSDSEQPLHRSIENLVLVFDGTGCDREYKGHISVIAEVQDCLTDPQGVNLVKYLAGVGPPSNILNKTVGGLLGLGIRRKIEEAIRWLILNYKPGRKIYLVGYSRGGFIVALVIEFLHRIGLPQTRSNGDDIHDDDIELLVKRFMNNHFAEARKEYKCITDVEVEAQACFDIVSTVGLPRTGPFKYIPRWHKREQYKKISVPKIVHNSIHAMPLHEQREPFIQSLLYLPADSPPSQKLTQMWFAGTHSDIGKEHKQLQQGGSLNDAPLAWVLSMLKNTGLPLNTQAVKRRFAHLALDSGKTWIRADAHKTYKGLMKIMGWHSRVPGKIESEEVRTFEEIHPSVHLRGFGATPGEKPVADHDYQSSSESDILSLSSRSGTWASMDSSNSNSVPEAAWTDFERDLLGLNV